MSIDAQAREIGIAIKGVTGKVKNAHQHAWVLGTGASFLKFRAWRSSPIHEHSVDLDTVLASAFGPGIWYL